MINVSQLSEKFPTWVSPDEYDRLKDLKVSGWSKCQTQKEWMVKLHYLRSGFKEGRVTRERFFQIEKELVLNWWAKWV